MPTQFAFQTSTPLQPNTARQGQVQWLQEHCLGMRGGLQTTTITRPFSRGLKTGVDEPTLPLLFSINKPAHIEQLPEDTYFPHLCRAKQAVCPAPTRFCTGILVLVSLPNQHSHHIAANSSCQWKYLNISRIGFWCSSKDDCLNHKWDQFQQAPSRKKKKNHTHRKWTNLSVGGIGIILGQDVSVSILVKRVFNGITELWHFTGRGLTETKTTGDQDKRRTNRVTCKKYNVRWDAKSCQFCCKKNYFCISVPCSFVLCASSKCQFYWIYNWSIQRRRPKIIIEQLSG